MKVRVFQLARDLKISSDALVNIITSLGAEVIIFAMFIGLLLIRPKGLLGKE